MYLRFALITLIFSQILACALVKPAPDDLNNQINLWLSENSYDKIDDALNSIKTSEINYTKILNRKAEILNKKQAYISGVLSTANKYKSNNQWQLAITTYDDALKKINNSKILKKGAADLLKERNQNARIIKYKLLASRASNLLSYKKSYEQLNLLLPNDYITQYEIHFYKSELKKTARQLNECAENSERSKQYTLAKDCYAQAYKIEPSPAQYEKIKALEKTIKNNTHQKTYSSLLKSYQVAYDNKKYNEAKKFLDEILSLNPDHQQAIKLYSKLKLTINDFVESKINLGKELYSQKKIQAALTIWKQAKELAPGNSELTQLIDRAEKVSKKIESLELSQ